MEHDLLEGRPALRDDEETDGRAPSHERLFDRTTASNEFLFVTERLRGWQCRGSRGTPVVALERRPFVGAPAFRARAIRSIRTRPATTGRAAERSATGRPSLARSVTRA